MRSLSIIKKLLHRKTNANIFSQFLFEKKNSPLMRCLSTVILLWFFLLNREVAETLLEDAK